MIDALVSAGTDPNAANADGMTPLMLALKKRRENVGMALIQATSNLEQRNEDGQTAAHIAFLATNPGFHGKRLEWLKQTLSALHTHGADITAEMPWQGSQATIRSLALSIGLMELVSLIDELTAGADKS